MNSQTTDPSRSFKSAALRRELENLARLNHATDNLKKFDSDAVAEAVTEVFEANKKELFKQDSGKLRIGLLPKKALGWVVRVLEYGARKYDTWAWRDNASEWTRQSDAVQRHIWAWEQGEDLDQETGLPHLAHAICGLLILLDLNDRRLGVDDRQRETVNEG